MRHGPGAQPTRVVTTMHSSSVAIALTFFSLALLTPHSSRAAADVDVIVWDGGRSQADGERALASLRSALPTLAKLGLQPAAGYPRLVTSDSVRGLKSGFHVALLGACASTATPAVLRRARVVSTGVYARPVPAGALELACPRVEADSQVFAPRGVLPTERARFCTALKLPPMPPDDDLFASAQREVALWCAGKNADVVSTLYEVGEGGCLSLTVRATFPYAPGIVGSEWERRRTLYCTAGAFGSREAKVFDVSMEWKARCFEDGSGNCGTAIERNASPWAIVDDADGVTLCVLEESGRWASRFTPDGLRATKQWPPGCPTRR